jgi:hypothetical protein
MIDRADTRKEIEPWFWDMNNLKWPVNGKTRPDLIIFDPPYFTKKAEGSAGHLLKGFDKTISLIRNPSWSSSDRK